MKALADKDLARHAAGKPACLVDLAAGWITAADLCGPCTRRFMHALDVETGLSLAWHSNYLNRTKGDTP